MYIFYFKVNSSNHVQLQALVYEQWLMTDLNQLCMSTIPDGVFQDKFTLNGMYVFNDLLIVMHCNL